MGFKLGTERGNYAISGEIRTKLRFHKESGDPDASVPGTPVIRKDLEPGVLGEEDLPTSERSVFYNNKSYTDKVYNKAIDDMIKDKER